MTPRAPGAEGGGGAVDRDGTPIKRGDHVQVVRGGSKSGRVARIAKTAFLPGNVPPTWRVELVDGSQVMSTSVALATPPAGSAARAGTTEGVVSQISTSDEGEKRDTETSPP